MGTIAQIFESGERRAQKGLFNNLVMLARVDGEVAASEQNLLKRIASRLSLTDEQVKEIMDHPDSYPMVPPSNKEERLERFIQFIEMVCIDGVVDPTEEDLANKYGVALGFDSDDLNEIETTIIEHFKAGKNRSEILEAMM
ncbi:MAG: TerB family tellurite resistance protein [bacterium]|nr:TerB family tellurite resistance protein [bacterium]